MFDVLTQNIERSLRLIKNNPQLLYTVVVGVMIIVAFFGVTYQFSKIAQDAQDRLVNVRIGSLQDGFVAFAAEFLDNSTFLNSKVQTIAAQNQTIELFDVVRYQNGVYTIVASLTTDRIGTQYDSVDELARLAMVNPNQSYTLQEFNGSNRYFRTARAILNADGHIAGLVISRQSLSIADQQVNTTIRNSLLLFVAVVVLIMFLFFRHARIIDYAVLYKRLKEVDTLKDDFIAMASHELRTPLAVIRGYVDEITHSANLTAEEVEFLRRIDISSAQLDQLVSDMLDVSRMEQGRMEFQLKELNALDAVQTIVETFTPAAEAKGLALLAEGAHIAIQADEDKLRQVLINIIGNAVKYTQEGEVKVTIADLPKQSMVEIRVSDTGIGMTAEEQARLFEKFYRVRNKETEEIRGTGLGLWLSREIVRKMHGNITVESIKGVGTHFVVQLPRYVG